jgi:hypothetical protein
MKYFNGQHFFFSLFFVARANQKIRNLAHGRETTLKPGLVGDNEEKATTKIDVNSDSIWLFSEPEHQ